MAVLGGIAQMSLISPDIKDLCFLEGSGDHRLEEVSDNEILERQGLLGLGFGPEAQELSSLLGLPPEWPSNIYS